MSLLDDQIEKEIEAKVDKEITAKAKVYDVPGFKSKARQLAILQILEEKHDLDEIQKADLKRLRDEFGKLIKAREEG